MKKTVMAAALAGVMLLSGCSGVSQDEYNSLLEENSRLQSENTSLQNNSSKKTSNEENSTSTEDDEYRMPKDHVKRVAKVLSLNFGTANIQNTSLGISQYNLEADCIVAGHNNQLKIIFNLTTNNTLQEKAAFCHYFLKSDFASHIEENVEKGIENAVIVAKDINDTPFVVWLVYNNNGNITHDMNIVDMAVLNSFDEVIRDSEKWKYIPVEQEPNSSTETSTSQSSSSTQTNPTESQTTSESTPVVTSYPVLYDDQFISISFGGIEKYSSKDCVVYMVENKNDFAIQVWDPTVSLDGYDLGEMSGMYYISPKSKGKVYFYKDDKSNIDNKNPTTVSGSLIVNSKGNEKINGQTYYEISFSGNIS